MIKNHLLNFTNVICNLKDDKTNIPVFPTYWNVWPGCALWNTGGGWGKGKVRERLVWMSGQGGKFGKGHRELGWSQSPSVLIRSLQLTIIYNPTIQGVGNLN